MNKALETNKENKNRRFPFYEVRHDEISYEKMKDVNPTNIKDVPFRKDTQFIKQKEYRFILEYGFPYLIDSLIFCGGIDYMERCFANPDMCKKQREELRLIIMKAMAGYGDFGGKEMGDIIANTEVLFR